MNKIRAILSGILVWVLVFSTFTVLSFIPATKDSPTLQNILVSLLLILFSYLGASFYYKGGNKTHGFLVALAMIMTILFLDAIITVPFVVIPQNGSYAAFFTSLILWILVVENILITYLYWRWRVKSQAF